MALNKAQLMEVPGGPGDVGAIKAGTGISIDPTTGVVSLNPTQNVVKLVSGGPLVVLNPPSGVGEVTVISTQALTAFEADFPAGTRMIFANANAPTGWTVVPGFLDMAVRLNTSGGGVTNTTAFSTIFTSYTASGNATLSGITMSGDTDTYNGVWSGSVSVSGSLSPTSLNSGTIASHSHAYSIAGQGGYIVKAGPNPVFVRTGTQGKTSGSTGGGSHSHSVSGSGSFSGSPNSHAHTVTGSVGGSVAMTSGNTIPLSVQYVDFLTCSLN
jgi:hypothetical protein